MVAVVGLDFELNNINTLQNIWRPCVGYFFK